jgi:putative hydrolase of the HAD superfamily
VNRTVVRAVLVDFGGVLTLDVEQAFGAFSAEIGAPHGLAWNLLTHDPEMTSLLVALERGELNDEQFETVYAGILSANEAPVSAHRLLARIHAHLRPDAAMEALVTELRKLGLATAVVSNSLGASNYDGFGLPSLVDTVVLSAEVGVRKPAREIYRLACKRLEVDPTEAVMIDDLAQNLAGAQRLGIRGVLHTTADNTRWQLRMLGLPVSSQPTQHLLGQLPRGGEELCHTSGHRC